MNRQKEAATEGSLLMDARLFLIMGVLLSITAVSRMVRAQDRGSDKPIQQAAPHGRIVHDAPDALRVEDMTMEELQQRLAEYEAGKRDDRDGYIVLNQIWFNLQAQRKTDSPEFLAVAKKREELLKNKPEFHNLQDFRLSEKIRKDKAGEELRKREVATAKQWSPTDKKPLRFFGARDQAVVAYQYRLEFCKLPPGHRLSRGKGTDRFRLHRGDDEIEPRALQPRKTFTFKSKFDIRPAFPDEIAFPFLVCTNPVARYTPTSPEERKTMQTLGHTHGMPWKNKAGDLEQFCGVVSLAGDVVFRFPFTQSLPKSVMVPLRMAEDGSWAAVMIGEVVQGEDYPVIGKPREVWIWRKSGGLEKHSAKADMSLVRELLQFFPKQ